MPDIHLTIGSSKAALTMKCQGWLAQSKDVPKQPESEYAKLGTALHKVFEQIVDNRGDYYWRNGDA